LLQGLARYTSAMGRLPKVLVVDDEDEVVELLTYGLGLAGFKVVVAPDGGSAVQVAQRCKPDVVLLDVSLPDVDGFSLLSELRAVTSSPVIFLTARSRNADRKQGLSLGAADYVTKPFEMDDLVKRVQRALV
jgi:two-component system OmpR family response regulator